MDPRAVFNGVVFVLLPAALLSLGFYMGFEVSASGWQKEKLSLQATQINELEKAQANYMDLIDKQRAKDKEVISGYQAEINAVQKRFNQLNHAGGLRLPRSICDQPNVPTTPSGQPSIAGGTAQTVVLPEQIERDLRALTREADEVTARCRAVIEAVK